MRYFILRDAASGELRYLQATDDESQAQALLDHEMKEVDKQAYLDAVDEVFNEDLPEEEEEASDEDLLAGWDFNGYSAEGWQAVLGGNDA